MSIAIEMPESICQAIKLPEKEVPARIRRELAVCLYTKQLLGLGKACELAGLSAWEFHDLLATDKVPRNFGVEDFQHDLESTSKCRR